MTTVADGHAGAIGELLRFIFAPESGRRPLVDVAQVYLNGSIAVGKHVMCVAARNLKPVTLELGDSERANFHIQACAIDQAPLSRDESVCNHERY